MTLRNFIAVLLLFLTLPVAAKTVIVSDQLPINVRAPGPNDRIVAAAKSGERLQVLEEQRGYLKVRTEDGDEGWVLTRFTQTEPVARERLAAAQKARDAAVAERDRLAAELTQLRQAHEELQARHQAVSARAEKLQAELDRVSAAAASTLEIQQANESLQQQVEELDAQNRALQVQLETHDSRRSALILGAGILLAGLLLGLILPYLRPRRNAWSDF